jgi:hypothetical protein
MPVFRDAGWNTLWKFLSTGTLASCLYLTTCLFVQTLVTIRTQWTGPKLNDTLHFDYYSASASLLVQLRIRSQWTIDRCCLCVDGSAPECASGYPSHGQSTRTESSHVSVQYNQNGNKCLVRISAATRDWGFSWISEVLLGKSGGRR